MVIFIREIMLPQVEIHIPGSTCLC